MSAVFRLEVALARPVDANEPEEQVGNKRFPSIRFNRCVRLLSFL